MDKRIWAAMDQAHCKTGPNKGHLKAKCPPMGTDAAIYWQAVQYETNPLRVSIAQLIFLTPEQKEFFEACVDWCKAARARSRKTTTADTTNPTTN